MSCASKKAFSYLQKGLVSISKMDCEAGVPGIFVQQFNYYFNYQNSKKDSEKHK